MRKKAFKQLEQYMQHCMRDSAHDTEHVYRVLYTALDIASTEQGVNYDVLIAACLLHDIGRQAQFENPALCHAQVGGDMAYAFLLKTGWSTAEATHIRACIQTHRFRSSDPPRTLEAKILFDADKLDTAGAMGIARTLLYNGRQGEPLYSLAPDGSISDGASDGCPSFFREYKHKLEGLYGRFYTARGMALARSRQQAAIDFYDNMLVEAQSARTRGLCQLERVME